MEEKEVKKEETMSVKGGIVLIVGAYVLGCFVGAANNTKKLNEAYSKGVTDTLEKIVFRNR